MLGSNFRAYNSKFCISNRDHDEFQGDAEELKIPRANHGCWANCLKFNRCGDQLAKFCQQRILEMPLP
jgi:hypothetical protein